MRILLPALLGLVPSIALACDPVPPPQPYAPTATTADTIPPSAPTLRFGQLHQEHGPQLNRPRCGGGSYLSIYAAGVTDDRTDAENLGYRFEVVEGELPADLEIPAGRLSPSTPAFGGSDADFVFRFGDSNEDVRFSIRAVAVDEAGNESAYSAPLLVTAEGGCSLGGAGAGGDLSLALATLPLLLIRRRRSR